MNERIRTLRNQLGMTLTDFGNKIGISFGGLADIERGRRSVQDRHIKLILAAFPQVSEKWLRTGEGDMFLPAAVDPELEAALASITIPDAAKAYIRLYDAQTPEIQQLLDDHLRKYLREVLGDKAPEWAKLQPGEDEEEERKDHEGEALADLYKREADREAQWKKEREAVQDEEPGASVQA